PGAGDAFQPAPEPGIRRLRVLGRRAAAQVPPHHQADGHHVLAVEADRAGTGTEHVQLVVRPLEVHLLLVQAPGGSLYFAAHREHAAGLLDHVQVAHAAFLEVASTALEVLARKHAGEITDGEPAE